MPNELYDGQAQVIAGKLAQAMALQQADRERLEHITDPTEREIVLRRVAGREGLLATQRRALADLTGEETSGARDKVIRLRVNDDEHQRLQDAACESGQTMSQYIRGRIL